MNKFHINVAESFNPKKISIQCNGELLAERDIEGPNKELKYTVNGRPLESSKTCYWSNATYTGNNIEGGRLKNIESASKCQQKCKENPNCGGFNWKANKTCFLKKEGGSLEENCGRRCKGKFAGLKNC